MPYIRTVPRRPLWDRNHDLRLNPSSAFAGNIHYLLTPRGKDGVEQIKNLPVTMLQGGANRSAFTDGGIGWESPYSSGGQMYFPAPAQNWDPGHATVFRVQAFGPTAYGTTYFISPGLTFARSNSDTAWKIQIDHTSFIPTTPNLRDGKSHVICWMSSRLTTGTALAKQFLFIDGELIFTTANNQTSVDTSAFNFGLGRPSTNRGSDCRFSALAVFKGHASPQWGREMSTNEGFYDLLSGGTPPKVFFSVGAPPGARPQGPLSHPLRGALAGPIGP